jgi:peptidoglycan/xylan/chitin deacetylase (PgdA/CDA1 family)
VLAAGLAAAAAGCSHGRSGSAEPASEPIEPAPTSEPAATGSPPASRPARSTAPPHPAGGPAVEVAHGPRTRPEVALTFHGAGDPAIALALLGMLETAHAQATVLVVGTWLAAHPQLAARIVGAGHELGNHTWTHPILDSLPEARARVEIERCRDVIARLTGSPGGHLRQSGSVHSTALVRRLAGAAGYPVCLSYDVDAVDWMDPGPAAVRRNVAAGVRPGSVVSLHFGHPGTVTALPGILADLDRRGLRAVTATKLLAS